MKHVAPFRLLLLILLGPWLLQEVVLAQLLCQPGWHSLLTAEDHWGTAKEGKGWKAYRGGGSGGEYYSLRAGGVQWNTCYDAGEIILKIDARQENARFLVYQPLSGNSNHYFQEHPEELVDGYWLIQKRGDRYERRPVLTHPLGLALRQFLGWSRAPQ